MTAIISYLTDSSRSPWVNCPTGFGSCVPVALDPVSQWLWILCPSGSQPCVLFSGSLSCVPVVLEPLSQWLSILCPNGLGSIVPVDLYSVSQWSWTHCPSGSGCIDVYIPHTKFPIYVNVQDPRYKMGDTFTRNFNEVALHTKYTI